MGVDAAAQVEQKKDGITTSDKSTPGDKPKDSTGADQGRDLAYGKKGEVVQTRGDSTAGGALGEGFGIGGADAAIAPEKGDQRNLPKPTVDVERMRQLAKDFDEATNGGWTGLGQDTAKVKEIIRGLNADEFKTFNDIFTKEIGSQYAKKGETWDVMKQLEYEKDHVWPYNMSERDFNFLKNSIAAKTNEVPEQFRVDGKALLKAESGLETGRFQDVKTADGTEYGIYVPKNADSRTPVIMAMHGAGKGDGKNVMRDESGLTQYAEKLGAIIVFPYPKQQNFTTFFGMGSVGGTAWNVPGRTDLPKEESSAYDDRVRIDNVRADLAKRLSLQSDQVGMIGFSDGGRFAQTYAADRPGQVAGIVSLHGTWMKGDAAPTTDAATPIRIVHSTGDETLKWTGGPGSMGSTMDGLLTEGTNLDKSEPQKQQEVWARANQCGEPVITQNGNTTITSYGNCRNGEVTVMLKNGGNHAIDEKLNDGSPTIQYWLGAPDLTGTDMIDSARWIKEQLVKKKAG